QLAAARVVEEQRRIRRLVLDGAAADRTHDLPALAGAPHVEAEPPAILLLPRDDREPVRDELEARQRPRLLLGDRAAAEREPGRGKRDLLPRYWWRSAAS